MNLLFCAAIFCLSVLGVAYLEMLVSTQVDLAGQEKGHRKDIDYQSDLHTDARLLRSIDFYRLVWIKYKAGSENRIINFHLHHSLSSLDARLFAERDSFSAINLFPPFPQSCAAKFFAQGKRGICSRFILKRTRYGADKWRGQCSGWAAPASVTGRVPWTVTYHVFTTRTLLWSVIGTTLDHPVHTREAPSGLWALAICTHAHVRRCRVHSPRSTTRGGYRSLIQIIFFKALFSLGTIHSAGCARAERGIHFRVIWWVKSRVGTVSKGKACGSSIERYCRLAESYPAYLGGTRWNGNAKWFTHRDSTASVIVRLVMRKCIKCNLESATEMILLIIDRV